MEFQRLLAFCTTNNGTGIKTTQNNSLLNREEIANVFRTLFRAFSLSARHQGPARSLSPSVHRKTCPQQLCQGLLKLIMDQWKLRSVIRNKGIRNLGLIILEPGFVRCLACHCAAANQTTAPIFQGVNSLSP